jgi:hypothetical protein
MRCGGCCGGCMGHIKPNLGNGGGHLHIGPPPRNLSFGQQIGMMANGNAKAQYTGRDFGHQVAANNANANARSTYANAAADGRISSFERRDINNANRGANIANKQVAYDTQRRHVGNLERNYAADGRLTMGERAHLSRERTQLGNMGRELNNLRAQDRAQDARDTAFKANPFNQFANAVGVGSTPAFRPMSLPRPVFAGIAAGATASLAGGAAAFAGVAAGAAGLAISSAANFAKANLAASWGASGSFNTSFSASSSWSGSASSTVNIAGGSFSSSLSTNLQVGLKFRAF